MLGFTSETPKERGPRLAVDKLKSEINSLAGELKFLKGRTRDPDLNLAVWKWGRGRGYSEEVKEFSAARSRRYKTRIRFNKLVTLRALLRGKVHFHKNTDFQSVDYALVKLGHFPTCDDLWCWTEDVRKEFEVSE